MMKDIKEMAGTSSNVYAALKELTDIDKTVGYRSPQEGEELENGHKIPKNAKIYFLTLDKEPIQPIQKLV